MKELTKRESDVAEAIRLLAADGRDITHKAIGELAGMPHRHVGMYLSHIRSKGHEVPVLKGGKAAPMPRFKNGRVKWGRRKKPGRKAKRVARPKPVVVSEPPPGVDLDTPAEAAKTIRKLAAKGHSPLNGLSAAFEAMAALSPEERERITKALAILQG